MTKQPDVHLRRVGSRITCVFCWATYFSLCLWVLSNGWTNISYVLLQPQRKSQRLSSVSPAKTMTLKKKKEFKYAYSTFTPCIFWWHALAHICNCFWLFFCFSVAKRCGAKTTARKEKGKTTSLTVHKTIHLKCYVIPSLACFWWNIQRCLCFDTIGSTCQSQKAKRGSQGQARGEERRAWGRKRRGSCRERKSWGGGIKMLPLHYSCHVK